MNELSRDHDRRLRALRALFRGRGPAPVRPVARGGRLLGRATPLAGLERELARAGLVVRRPREPVGARRDVALEAAAPFDHAPGLADWLEPAPADLRERQLRALFAAGRFDTSRDRHLTALALVRMLDRRDLIETHFPMLDYAAFLLHRARVLDEVARTLPKRAESFARAWEKLSNEQKEALEWTFVHGEGSLDRVARKLRLDPRALAEHAREGLRLLELALGAQPAR